EAYRSPQQLAGSHRKGRMPQDVVKAGADPPGPQRMKQNRVGVGGLVRMVLVPQLAPFVIGPKERLQLAPQLLDLLVVQDTHTSQIPVLVVERDLLVGQPIAIP